MPSRARGNNVFHCLDSEQYNYVRGRSWRLPRRGVLGRDRDGTLVAPAPVDYVSWTERIAGFAGSEDLKVAQWTVLLTGKMSPRAKKEFEALDCTVREGIGS